MNTNLNEQIKNLRMSRKLTLASLAEKLGVTTSAVAAYENGKRNPSFEVLIKLAQVFNVTIDNLLGYSDKDLIDVSGLSFSQRDSVESLISTYKKLNLLVVERFGFDNNLDKDKIILEKVEGYLNSDFEKFVEVLKFKKL